MTAQDLDDTFAEWEDQYKVVEFLENTEENWAKVQELDEHLVWTNHSTCENEQITNGATQYQGCCWDSHGWFVAELPWEDGVGYLSFDTSASLYCQTCNVDGEEATIDENCPECDGNGYVQHYSY